MVDDAAGRRRTADDRDHRDPLQARAPLSRPVAGAVIGFALRWDGQKHGALWMSGETVALRGVRRVAERVDVGVVLLYLGAVPFP